MLELWIGESSKRPVIRSHNKVLDSAINYLSSDKPRIPYTYNELFLDSGAFTISRRGLTVSKERIKSIQEKLYPDKAVPLDYPFKPGQSIKEMERLWEMTKANILEWQETTKLKEIVPVLHAWSRSSIKKNILWIHKYVDAEYVGIGTIINPGFRGYFADRQLNLKTLELLSYTVKIIKGITDFKIHLMGFGSSPLTLHIAYYMGVDSLDTTGYRRKAAFGKIILPGAGERYVGRGDAKFGVRKGNLSYSDWRTLLECKCPICREDRSLLWRDWVARAIHNKFVLETETMKAKYLLNNSVRVYEEYLNKIFLNSSTCFRAYWRFLKKSVGQKVLDTYLW